MGAAQYVVRCWTCACGDRFLAWPEEHIEDYMLWHQRAFHQRGDMHHAKDGEHRAMQDFACVCGYFTKSADMLVKHLRSAPKYSDDRHEACV